MFTYSLYVKIHHGLFFRLYIFESESPILVSILTDNFHKFSMASSDDFFFLIFLCIYDTWNLSSLTRDRTYIPCIGIVES